MYRNIVVENITTGYIHIFDSISTICKELKLDNSHIADCLRGDKSQYRGYKFYLKEE